MTAGTAQVVEGHVKGPLDLVGDDHRRPGLVGVAFEEGIDGLLQHLPRFAGHQLDLTLE
jgi:hypothetical protein